MFNPTSPITGAAQTGFTSPTYTFVDDIAPDVNGRQKAVSALGGTQAGVTVHSVASPFTLTFTRPKAFKALGTPNPVTGRLPAYPRNSYVTITRKGVSVASNQPFQTLIIRTTIEVPAGADTADPANVRAALSAHIGLLNQQSAGLGDTTVTGTM